MNKRRVTVSFEFSTDLMALIDADDDATMNRVYAFLEELAVHPEVGTAYQYGIPLFHGHSGDQYTYTFERFIFVYQFNHANLWLKNVLPASRYGA